MQVVSLGCGGLWTRGEGGREDFGLWTDCTGFGRSEYCSTVVVVHGAILVWRLWWWSLSNHMASWPWRRLKCEVGEARGWLEHPQSTHCKPPLLRSLLRPRICRDLCRGCRSNAILHLFIVFYFL
jgi:hypothetical protein